MNSAISEPPNPKPMRIAEAVFWKIMMMTVAPSRPRPTVYMPATPPVRNATLSAALSEPDLAASAVRTLPRTASLMPMKPVRPGERQPGDERDRAPHAGLAEGEPDEPPSEPFGFSTSTEVTNTRTATGTRITAMVRNCRRRYAIAPSWMAAAISIIFGVP